MHPNTHRAVLLERGLTLLISRDVLLASGESLQAAIMASIANGKHTRNAIIHSVMALVGHRFAQVARALDAGTGNNPRAKAWYRDQMQRYHLHANIDPRPVSHSSGFADDLDDDVPF